MMGHNSYDAELAKVMLEVEDNAKLIVAGESTKKKCWGNIIAQVPAIDAKLRTHAATDFLRKRLREVGLSVSINDIAAARWVAYDGEMDKNHRAVIFDPDGRLIQLFLQESGDFGKTNTPHSFRLAFEREARKEAQELWAENGSMDGLSYLDDGYVTEDQVSKWIDQYKWKHTQEAKEFSVIAKLISDARTLAQSAVEEEAKAGKATLESLKKTFGKAYDDAMAEVEKAEAEKAKAAAEKEKVTALVNDGMSAKEAREHLVEQKVREELASKAKNVKVRSDEELDAEFD